MRGIRVAPGETVERQVFFKPSHAELLLLTIDQQGFSGKPADALASLIERTAANLGAAVIRPDELRRAAEIQVAVITARVKASNQSGGLKQWNAAYKQYRQQQIAKAEKAIPYSAYLQRVVVATMVRQVAASGRAI